MAEWTTTTHKRTAWITEQTFEIEDSTASEWVLPFSVVSPNVNFPAAIAPLLMRRSMAGRHEKFGRSYRYSALVNFSGSSETVDVSAGFTAFMPTSQLTDRGEDPPEVTVEALHDPTARMACPDGRGNRVEDPLRLRVVIEGQHGLVQGLLTYINVTVIDGGDSSPSTIRTQTTHLEPWISPNWAPPRRDADITSTSRFRHLKELSAQMWKTAEKPHYGHETPLPGASSSLYVSPSFPCTAPTGPDAPFRVEAYLVITIIEHRNRPHLNPLDHMHGVYVSRPRRPHEGAESATESGWEFGACDQAHFHSLQYTARIPVTILSPRYSSAVSYLENDGRVPMPRILSGHIVQRRSRTDNFEFAIADPVSVRETRTAVAPSRDMFAGFGDVEAIDTGAGDYVGALWESRLHREGAPSARRPETGQGQVVLQS